MDGLLSGVDLEQVNQLVHVNRNLDAYSATRHLWNDRSALEQLDSKGLVLAVRLARRIGGFTHAEYIRRFAVKKFANQPEIRYYMSSDFSRDLEPWQMLQKHIQLGPLGSGVPELDSSWLVSRAHQQLQFRDFIGARESLVQAEQIDPDSYWVEASWAQFYFDSHQLNQAQYWAEKSWDRVPGHSLSGSIKVRLMALSQGPAKAAQFCMDWIQQGGQNFDLLDMGLHYAFDVVAERPNQMAKQRETLWKWVEKASRFWPLADRMARHRLDRLKLAASVKLGRPEFLLQWAEKKKSGFYFDLAQNLKTRPLGHKVLLNIKAIKQDFKTCLPASAAMCASAFGVELDQTDLAKKITLDGTSSWRFHEWCRENDWHSFSFSFTEESAKALLSNGFPFIVTYGDLGWSHACAAIGFDDQLRILYVRDPSCSSLSQALMVPFEAQDEPVGQECIVFYPKNGSQKLPDMEFKNTEYWRAFNSFIQNLEPERWQERKSWGENLPQLAPALMDYLLIRRDMEEGLIDSAMQRANRMLELNPENQLAQSCYLRLIELSPDRQSVIPMLKRIAELEPLPGVQAEKVKIYPPATLFARLADYLRWSPNGQAEALSVLQKGLSYFPTDSRVLESLANWHREANQPETATFLFRLASCLHPENEELAFNYAFGLVNAGLGQDAVDFLRARAESDSLDLAVPQALQTLINFHLQLGQKEQAERALSQALDRVPDDSSFNMFAVTKFLEIGDLSRAKSIAGDGLAFDPRVQLLNQIGIWQFQGRWEKACSAIEAFLAIHPKDEQLFRLQVFIMARAHGAEAAFGFIRAQKGVLPDDVWWQEYLEWIDQHRLEEPYHEALLRYLTQYPFSRWAARELAWEAVHFLQRDPTMPAESRQQYEEWIERALSMGGFDGPYLGLRAKQAELAGDAERALEGYLEAIRAEPRYVYALGPLSLLLTRNFPERKEQVAETFSQMVLTEPGPAFFASAFGEWLRDTLGMSRALTEISRWCEAKPNDYYVLRAQFQVQIQGAQGASAWQPLVEPLQAAIGTYPNQFGLRTLLGELYLCLNQADAARKQYRALLLRQPKMGSSWLALANVYKNVSQNRKSLDMLRLGIRHQPDALELILALADRFEELDQFENALTVLEQGRKRLPSALEIWSRLANLYPQMGKTDLALRMASELISAFPEQAQALLIACQIREDWDEAVALADLEATYLKAIQCDRSEYDGHWQYVQFLARQQRFAEAERHLREQAPFIRDHLGVLGARAQLLRSQGDKAGSLRLLADTLRENPEYVWGWARLMEWAKEDKVIAEYVPLVRTLMDIALQNGDLHLARFEFLAEALGTPEERMAEWQRLCAAFPDHVEIWAGWGDVLHARNEKEALVDHLEAFPGKRDLSYWVARLERGRDWSLSDEAQIHTYTSILNLGKQTQMSDALGYILYHFHQNRWFSKAVASSMRRIVQEGLCFSNEVFEHLCDAAAQLNYSDGLRKCAQKLESLPADPDVDYCLSRALVELAKSGNSAYTLTFLQRSPSRFKEGPLWMAVGYAYLVVNQFRDVIRWVEPWPSKLPHIHSWICYNLVIALRAMDRYSEVIQQVDKIMETGSRQPGFLTPHLAAGLRLKKSEALLLMGDVQGFLDYWPRSVFRVEKCSESKFLNDCYQHLVQGSGVTALDASWLESELQENPIYQKIYNKVWYVLYDRDPKPKKNQKPLTYKKPPAPAHLEAVPPWVWIGLWLVFLLLRAC